MCASASVLIEKGEELGGGRRYMLFSSVRVNDDLSRIRFRSVEGLCTKASSGQGVRCCPSDAQVAELVEVLSLIATKLAPGYCIRIGTPWPAE
ncbi:hypothetical protein GW17_00049783 [Ensete ventricosum]|nr:hypothetical protein GW17_00049783 [Ensete ventricosum]RZS27565.1 hypothetical protein BHM03_00061058 [Ensete ventricosum]